MGPAPMQPGGAETALGTACRDYLQLLMQHLVQASSSQPPAVPEGALEVMLRAAAVVLNRPVHVAQPGAETPVLLVFPPWEGE